jgi:hypothetical protein
MLRIPYCLDKEVKKDEMGRACSIHEENRSLFRILGFKARRK